jgi:BirA family biotin operon repressor/biotin-[acetyl-CoA-carboxylase] ligase
MKGRILSILRAERDVVSGEELSLRLEVSRVSVWKHIQKLKELGYPIDATPKGYQLGREMDALFPWEFPERAARMHYLEEADSTMDIARDLARKGCPDFSVVIAGQQKKGRGRLKRTWLSAPGGLYFTMVLRPRIPAVFSTRVNFAASMILARTLRRMFAVEAMVKWPNDILIDDLKLAGMLSEMEAEGEMVSFINIGLGINVNNDPTAVEPKAVSLRKVTGKTVSKQKLLAKYLDEFEAYLNTTDLEDAISEWKHYAVTLNRMVRVVTEREVLEGLAVDVDKDGGLLMELADGSSRRVIYGDCFHS